MPNYVIPPRFRRLQTKTPSESSKKIDGSNSTPYNIAKLPTELLCKVFKHQTDDVEGKMNNSLVCKSFHKAINDERAWVHDTKLVLMTIGRKMVVNGKEFQRTTEVEKAMSQYLALTQIKTLICNFGHIDVVKMRAFCRQMERNQIHIKIERLALQFEAHERFEGLPILIDTLFKCSPLCFIKEFSLSVRSKIHRVRPEKIPLVRKFLEHKLWDYMMNCTSMVKLNIRVECPMVVSLVILPQVIKSLPGLENLYVNVQDETNDFERNALVESLNALNLDTLRLRMKIEDLDQFIYDHDQERRNTITSLKFTPFDKAGEHWAEYTVHRILNMYRSLTKLDFNRFHTHHHWTIEIIANVVKTALLQLRYRAFPFVTIKMRNHIGSDVVVRVFRKTHASIQVTYEGNFRFTCMYGRAGVILEMF